MEKFQVAIAVIQMRIKMAETKVLTVKTQIGYSVMVETAMIKRAIGLTKLTIIIAVVLLCFERTTKVQAQDDKPESVLSLVDKINALKSKLAERGESSEREALYKDLSDIAHDLFRLEDHPKTNTVLAFEFLVESNSPNFIKGDAYRMLGQTLWFTSQHASSAQVYRDAIEWINSVDKEADSRQLYGLKTEYFHKLGASLASTGDSEGSIEVNELVLLSPELRKHLSHSQIASIMLRTGQQYDKLGDKQRTAGSFQQWLEYIEEHELEQDPLLMINVLHSVAKAEAVDAEELVGRLMKIWNDEQYKDKPPVLLVGREILRLYLKEFEQPDKVLEFSPKVTKRAKTFYESRHQRELRDVRVSDIRDYWKEVVVVTAKLWWERKEQDKAKKVVEEFVDATKDREIQYILPRELWKLVAEESVLDTFEQKKSDRRR